VQTRTESAQNWRRRSPRGEHTISRKHVQKTSKIALAYYMKRNSKTLRRSAHSRFFEIAKEPATFGIVIFDGFLRFGRVLDALWPAEGLSTGFRTAGYTARGPRCFLYNYEPPYPGGGRLAPRRHAFYASRDVTRAYKSYARL